MHLVIRKSCAWLMYVCTSPWILKVPLAGWNFPSDRSAAQPGQHASVGMNQAVRDSQIRSLGTDLGRRAYHPRQAPCLRSCGPARDSRRISSPEPNPAAPSSKGETGGRSLSRGAGRRAHWTGTCCRVRIPMSDRPTCLSSTCGLGAIKRFRRAPRRQVCRSATAKQSSLLLRSP